MRRRAGNNGTGRESEKWRRFSWRSRASVLLALVFLLLCIPHRLDLRFGTRDPDVAPTLPNRRYLLCATVQGCRRPSDANPMAKQD
jgi:hypothetical protein